MWGEDQDVLSLCGLGTHFREQVHQSPGPSLHHRYCERGEQRVWGIGSGGGLRLTRASAECEPWVCGCYCESRGLMTVPTRRKPVIRYLPRFCHFHSSSKSLLCGGIGPRAALPLARHFLCHQATLNCKGMDPMLSFGPSKIPSRWPNRQSWPSSSRNPAHVQRSPSCRTGF